MVAEAIGIARGDVLVHTTFAGGGFGRRGVADYVAQAAQIAKQIGKPVQMLWTRESDMTQGFYRPQLTAHMRGAVDSGKLTAFTSHTVGQPILLSSELFMRAAMPIGLPGGMRKVMANTALAMFGTGSLPDFFGTEGVREFPYRTDNVKVTITPVDSGLPVCFWRSVGHSFNGFAVEGFIDELAYLAKRDPFEFRRDNLAVGSPERRVLEAVAKLASWGSPLPAGRGRGIAQHMAFDTHVAEVAEVEMAGDRIAVKKVYAAIDCGVAVNPDVIKAQVEGAIIYGLSAALDQEITLAEGVVRQRNFDTFPPLRLIDCPEIVVHIIDSDDDPTGVGEPGLPPVAPAVANAVFAATGVRLRRMPLHRAWRERSQG
jgi:isoquinoline 1-oxidoreductase/isoquinoline 1-oxidoreductase beta subunit